MCESSNEMQKITEVPLSSSNYISQPCVAATYLTVNGPTKILPFLYLGSQQDAMNEKLLKVFFIYLFEQPSRAKSFMSL